MRIIRVEALLVAGLAALTGPRTATAQCLPVDSAAFRMKDRVTGLATETSQQTWIAMRNRQKIPFVSASQVTRVSTARVCSSALSVYKRRIPASFPPPTAVHVLSVGSVYVVWVPPAPESEWMRVVVLDSKYKMLSEFGW